MSKHILLYTDDPGLGGVAQYNHSLLCGLAALGYRLTCVQSESSNPLVDHRHDLGIQHLWLEYDTTKDFQRTLINPADAQKILSGAKPDLIIFSDCWPMSNSAAKRVAIEQRIPYIVVVGFVAPYPEGLPEVYLDELRGTYTQAKAAIAVSHENLNLLHELFGLPQDKGQVIYYGRSAQYFLPPNSSVRERLRQEYNIPADAVVCFTAARLDVIKGFQYQIAAIEQLKLSNIWHQIYFVWAGAGELEKQLREAVNQLEVTDKVKILGQRWDIPDWLDAIDIFILPSHSEGMPLSIMEAMAKGLPAIATAVSGIPEELGDTGKLLPDPKVDPQATLRELVATIQAWCVNPELRYSIGQAAHRRAEKIFREERMIKETVEVIERALLPMGDYVSPGFEIIRPDECFPNITVADTKMCHWEYLRREVPHNWYADKRQPVIGFLSRDEAHILYNTALKFKGKQALEIGCWLGWSACHLALAGVELDVIDPVLGRPEFNESVSNSLRAAGVLDSVNLISGYSPQKVEELATQKQRKWSLIFIDGDHNAPGPLTDAILCEQLAQPNALILFHDLASPDVAQGLDYLKQKGWQTMVYQTMQIMGVAWRGNVEPVRHQPDPKIRWELPQHLQGYCVSGWFKEDTSIKVGGNATMSLDAVIANIRKLPPDWHSGGALSVEVLEAIVRHVGSRQLLHSMETGSGASTLLLSHLSKEHKVFSYDCGGNGLSVVRSSTLLNKENVDFIEGPTQITLPPYKFENKIQLALIDGPHGYPFPDLEYYFIYPHLEENALLIIDDIWIPNIANLFNFLREDAMFELIDIVGKTAFLRRTDAQLLNPVGDDWFLQNYNKNRFPITSFENIYSYSEAAKIENKKALVFFPHKPYPPRTGAHQRCISMLGGLKKLGYDVTLFGSNLITDNPWPGDSTQELQELQELQEQLGVKVEVYQGTQADRQFMAQVMEQMQARGELVNWDFYTPPGLRERFRQVFAQLTPDLIMINYSLWGKLATGNEFRSALRVMDMIDLYTLNMQMRQVLALNLSTAPFTPEHTDPGLVEEDLFLKLQLDALPEEYAIFDQYDCTIAISPREGQAIREHTQRTSVEYVPMTFAIEPLANTYSGAPLFAVGPNSFNIQGYLYFATKVLPIVLRQLPEFSLRVVGSSCNQLVAVDGMQLLGFVPDLKPLYCESRFAICPLIGGTGQQVKIVEAMAHGVPVIALRNVAESSPIEHGVNGFIADNAEEFAQYTIELFGDRELCRKLGQAARETIAKNFSQDILLSKLKAVTEKPKIERLSPIIVIDAVFFQLYKTGIARVWQSLLEEWVENGFAQHIVVLDRAGTAPKISGIQYRSVPPYDYGATDGDRKMLQEVCDEQDADLFISTYYTTPLSTPYVFMAYDMIPEVMEWDLANPMWSEKNHGIQEASAYLAISESTARDLVKFFPHISPESVTVAHCGVKSTFSPASLEEVNQFKTKYGISKPYFIIVGTGGYKNTILFFQAFGQLHTRESFEIVCTGSGGFLQDEFRAYTSGSVVHMLQLSDRELRCAYSGAVALVYPSKYEGFGLPILEALACGCPVITCRNASIPEVAGEAAIYVNDADANELANAFCDIQKPEIRGSLIAAGLEQAKKFSWAKMARTVSSVLIDTTLLPLKLRDINLIIFPDWSQPEELLCVELAEVIRGIATHPKRSQMTLLIHTGNISKEDANLVLSAVTMELLMQEDLDVTEGVQISFVGHMGEFQWKALLARLQARIVLESENQDAIAQVEAENLQSCQLDSFA